MTHSLEDFLTDAAGRLVPRENVKPEHLLQDEMVRRLFEKAQALRQQIHDFRVESETEIHCFLSLLSEKYGSTKGGAKGNVSLTSYDGLLRVQLAVNELIAFGPELQVAKELIDSCLTRWTEGGNANLRAVVTDAFDVGKEGKLNISRILGLRRLDINDDEWGRAMQAITDAVTVNATRSYVRFHEKSAPHSGYALLPLDLAKA